jgi:hypothetical protein
MALWRAFSILVICLRTLGDVMSARGDFLLTPNGYRHSSLVHTVKGGERIKREGRVWQRLSQSGEHLATVGFSDLPASQLIPTPASGWVSFADWKNSTGNPVTFFETTWVVPPAPGTASNQTVFLFNALQTTAQDHILQPVLQWGQSAAPGGGEFWAIASWWVGGKTDPLFITELVPVNSGAVLVGRISLTAVNSGLFNYVSEFVGVNGTAITAENLPELTDCTETLEAYEIAADSDYPNNDHTAFKDIKLEVRGGAAPLTWSAQGNFPPRIISNSASGGEIDIYYPTAEH